MPGERRSTLATKATVGIDTNVLAYLIQASNGKYDPSLDEDMILRAERIAAYRIFLYSPALAVGPTVSDEIEKTVDAEERVQLIRFRDVLLVELLELDTRHVEQRVKSLLRYHRQGRDCRIVAESEVGGLEVLLTFDRELRKHLDGRSELLRLRYPSEHWVKMSIPCGQIPHWSPARSNPLFDVTWWRWQ